MNEHAHFGPEVDDSLVERLVDTEQSCCSCLEVAYEDGGVHALPLDRRDDVALYAGYLTEGGR